MRYNKRVWLNKKGIRSTGSVVAFHGKVKFDKKWETLSILEIADCHSKVCLHQSPSESEKDFVAKLRKLSRVINDFADALNKYRRR